MQNTGQKKDCMLKEKMHCYDIVDWTCQHCADRSMMNGDNFLYGGSDMSRRDLL
jgi:hypothetical protein